MVQFGDRQSFENVVLAGFLSAVRFFVNCHILSMGTCRSEYLFNLMLLFRLLLPIHSLLLFCSYLLFFEHQKQRIQRKKRMLLFSHQLNSFILSRRSTCDPIQECSMHTTLFDCKRILARTFVRKNDIDFKPFGTLCFFFFKAVLPVYSYNEINTFAIF